MLQNNHDQALVLYIAEKAAGSEGLGKKAVQKLVHLVTSVGDVPTGYEFSLYTYGPFSRDLSDDIDLLESVSALDVKYQSAQNRYDIRAGNEAGRYISQSTAFLGQYSERIDNILSFFSGRTARSLEMTSTLLFVLKQSDGPDMSDDLVVEKFRVIKPHFGSLEAKEALSELKRLLSDSHS